MCVCVRACVRACVFARLRVSMPARAVCMHVTHRVLLGDGKNLDDSVLLLWQSQVLMGGGREARPPRPSPSAPSHADLFLLTRSTAEVGPAYFTHRLTVNNPSTFTFIVGPGLSWACRAFCVEPLVIQLSRDPPRGDTVQIPHARRLPLSRHVPCFGVPLKRGTWKTSSLLRFRVPQPQSTATAGGRAHRTPRAAARPLRAVQCAMACACTHTPALQIWRVCAAASRHLSCMPALHLFCSRGGCTVAVWDDSFRRQALPVS